MAKGITFETTDANAAVQMGSERSFGLVFAVVFSIVGGWPAIAGNDVRLWAFGVSVAFLAAGILRPRILKPLNLLWFRFGMAMHRIVSPLILGLLFFLTITPIGLLMRAVGKDPLRLAFDRSAKSYWIPRDPPGPAPETMKNQF